LQKLLPHLAVYLGHVGPENTYWYLSGTPELLRAASARFESQHSEGPTRVWAIIGSIAQQAAKDHQPRCLGPPIVQPGELTRQKLHKIVEANLTPSDVADRKTRREKPVDYMVVKLRVERDRPRTVSK
jgi:hypothetical protein